MSAPPEIRIVPRLVAEPEPWTADMLTWLEEDWDGRYRAERMADWLDGWRARDASKEGITDV